MNRHIEREDLRRLQDELAAEARRLHTGNDDNGSVERRLERLLRMIQGERRT